jgi:hypothetical protein
LPVNLFGDGEVKGIRERAGIFSLPAISDYLSHTLLIKRSFEENGFGSLDQSGQGFPEAVRRKMGRSDEERYLAVFFHPPNRPQTFFLPGE